jgi:hypothetical protein
VKKINKILLKVIFFNPAWGQQNEEVFRDHDRLQEVYPAWASYRDRPSP